MVTFRLNKILVARLLLCLSLQVFVAFVCFSGGGGGGGSGVKFASAFVPLRLATSSTIGKQLRQQRQQQRQFTNNHDEFSLLLMSSFDVGTHQQQQLGKSICFYTEIDVSTFTTKKEEDEDERLQQQQQQQQQQPRQEIVVVDLTSRIQQLVTASNLQDGTITLISKHTTTSLLINEYEKRLIDDIRDFFQNLIPPDDRSVSSSSSSSSASSAGKPAVRYKHNDIHLRPDGDDERVRCLENGWDVDDPTELQRWRDQEPINAHSHLLAMTVGSQSECIPVSDSKLCIGQWQSIMLLDLDAPRSRKVGVHIMGYDSSSTR